MAVNKGAKPSNAGIKALLSPIKSSFPRGLRNGMALKKSFTVVSFGKNPPKITGSPPINSSK